MSTINYTVKVASGKFTIDQAVAPSLSFRDGDTYVFDQADNSNSGHTLQFSATSNNSGSSEYTTGVTKTGTAGSAGAKTTIITSGSTTDTLYYYSSGGGTHGNEFKNSGYTTTATYNLLKPIVGSVDTAERWGSMMNHAIDQLDSQIASGASESFERYIYTLASSTTTISGADDNSASLSFTAVAAVEVFLNGILLTLTDDYTLTPASNLVTLNSAASSGDTVNVHVFKSFEVSDAVSSVTGGTFSGEITAPSLKLSSNVIKASDGGSTITLDTSDNVTIAGGLTVTGGITNAGTVSAGILGSAVSADHLKVLTEVDQWRITADFSSDATPLTTNWTRVNKVGTGFATPTSGVFSFPSTGLWWVLFETYGIKADNGACVRMNVYIEGATDKSGSYSTIAQGKQSSYDAGFGQVRAQCIFDCTSIHATTGSAVRMNVESAGASTFEGDANITATSVTFLKLGDT